MFRLGKRERKDVDYSDNLTDKQFLKVIFKDFICHLWLSLMYQAWIGVIYVR